MKPRLFALLFVAGLLVLGILAIACGDDGGENDEDAINGEITVDDLIGTWRGRATSSFLQLSEDGTYRIATSAEDIENTTVEQGQFTLEGTLFTFISNEDSQNCAAGQRGSYEIEVLEEGPSGEDRIKQIQVEDECSIRGSVGFVTLERVP